MFGEVSLLSWFANCSPFIPSYPEDEFHSNVPRIWIIWSGGHQSSTLQQSVGRGYPASNAAPPPDPCLNKQDWSSLMSSSIDNLLRILSILSQTLRLRLRFSLSLTIELVKVMRASNPRHVSSMDYWRFSFRLSDWDLRFRFSLTIEMRASKAFMDISGMSSWCS